MKAKSKQEELSEGLRQLALFIFAMMILANAAWHHFAGQPHTTETPAINTIYLSGGKLVTGIYQIEKETTFAELYRQANLSLPKESLFNSHQIVPAHATVTLKNGQPPTISGPSPSLTPIAFLPLPINHANAEQIATISGIGPALAQRIVDYRRTHGEFTKVEQLLKIKGIGPKTIKKIASSLSFS